MNGKRRLVVIGGVAGGMSAAARARRMDPELEIIAYEKTGYVSYGSCGLPYLIAGVVANGSDLVARTPEKFREGGIEVHTRHEVTSIDVSRQEVRVRSLDERREFSVPYDLLVIATGGAAVEPPIPGTDLGGVFSLRHVEDGIMIKEFLSEKGPRRAVIVGGGYIGVEVAEAFVERGLETTLLTRPGQVLANFDPDMAELMQDELERHGVAVSVDDTAQAIEGDPAGRARAVISSRGRYEADLVMLAAGVRPQSALAKEAGIKLGVKGAIAVDAGMRTNVPGVFAAGDCAEAFHLLLNQPSYLPLGTTANKQGRVAGTNAAGGDVSFGGIVGTSITKAFGLGIGVTGLTEKKVQELGRRAEAVSIQHLSRAHYYPSPGPLHVKLVWDPTEGTILGGQIAGPVGDAKRIDVLAAAVHQGITIQELQGFDLSYAPPFAPVWDPLLVAARVAIKD
jgi:NADPH-dependent 2,4-dienoyl-CoA reductase/sulfur reductase-like enzyme